MKYLSRFKWTHLNERLAYEKEVHKQRLRTEIMQVCSLQFIFKMYFRAVTHWRKLASLRLCLHVPTPSQLPSKFNIMPVVTGTLTSRKSGSTPILPVKKDQWSRSTVTVRVNRP